MSKSNENIVWGSAIPGIGVAQGSKVACVGCKRNGADFSAIQSPTTPLSRSADERGV